ncbi:protein FAR-RED ELONGATED HYPOCOTYL 3-like [Lactuca sativa]|uniref:protein FAR-RED ELONGATED HYPOCOTYL 3-like n=1 Tax=Lactuca sativa TaxID=4236 RepID=UPI0022AF306E|nr:protein FAR-RED ELONGATED HYPOCOTYL 3-like [Lactuca sativa]
MTELQRENLFEFGEVPEIDDRRCEEKSNEGWSDDAYTQQKTVFNPWYCIPSIPDCPEPILEPGPSHSLGPNDKLIVNQTYNTKKELAFAVKFKAVREKFQIKVEKSSKSRYQVVCMQENCHWRLYACVIKGTKMFEIKTFNDEHTCSSLLIHPNHRQHASEFALGLMMGTPEESFSKLPIYFHNLKKHNPGTVAYIKTDSDDRFEHCFFAIGCAIHAFRECCRKVIIMDGAHLKGNYKGTILHAVAMDGNNQILPIGYGICPKETTDSWTWFLEKLHECIGDVEGLTMVTNRAPAIAVSIQNVFPNDQHGLCGFHLIGNIVQTFGKNKKTAILFWKLVRAYKTTEFEFYWGRLRNIRDDVATYLGQIPREKWTRAYCPTTRYDYMTSNSAESMNARTCKEIVPKNQSKTKKRTGASGSGTKATEEEQTQATKNQWQHEPENQWTQHTEQQWQQQPDNQLTQQTKHQWQQHPDNQWTKQTEHQWQQELHNQWAQETEYQPQEAPQNQWQGCTEYQWQQEPDNQWT